MLTKLPGISAEVNSYPKTVMAIVKIAKNTPATIHNVFPKAALLNGNDFNEIFSFCPSAPAKANFL